MPEHELMPAITALTRRVDEAERKANNLRSALNILREDAGLPPQPPGSGEQPNDNANPATEIQSDTFFRKKQQTAIREYLEMRRAQGLGPAKPREIYEALVAGGYKYVARDAETALVGLRAILRKRTNVFAKVGNGEYGLASWYPDAKERKVALELDDLDIEYSEDDEDDESESVGPEVESETANDDEASSAA